MRYQRTSSIEVSRCSNGYVARKRVLDYDLAEVFVFTKMDELLGWIRRNLAETTEEDPRQRKLFHVGRR